MPHGAPPTTWHVPALTANQLTLRNWHELFASSHRHPPVAIRIDNHIGSATLTVRGTSGEALTVGPGAVITFSRDDLGELTHYSLTASANTLLGDTRVYELYDLEDNDREG